MVVGIPRFQPFNDTSSNIDICLDYGESEIQSGTVSNNVLWLLALVLLLMSLGFNIGSWEKEKLWTLKIDTCYQHVLWLLALLYNPGSLDSLYLGSGYHISWSFLTSRSSSYSWGRNSVQLYNSFFLLVITWLFLSMGAGIFLSEYAKKRTTYQLCPVLLKSSLPQWSDSWLFDFSLLQYDFQLIRCLGLIVFNLPQMTRTVEDSQEPFTIPNVAGLALGLGPMGKLSVTLLFQKPYLVLLLVSFFTGRIFGEAAALIYTAGQSAPALTGATGIRLASLVHFDFPPSRHFAVHIWKVTRRYDTWRHCSICWFNSSALDFLLIFNFAHRVVWGAYP